MTGTIINIIAILIGGTIGTSLGKRLPDNIHHTVMNCLGLFTVAIGMQMFIKTENPIIVLGSLLIGCLVGEWLKLEDRLNGIGAWLENRFGNTKEKNSGESLFIKGFVTSSLVFCIGPLAILGSIQDGLLGDYQLLAIKSVLDFFASIAFASTLGIGVLFSALTILVYQGGISLLAFQAQTIATPSAMNEMTAVGGVLLIGIGISSLLELKRVRMGNFLPSLLIAPLIVLVISLL